MTCQNLVIVESPAKAKTIEKILGKNYHVVASFGHVRDLPKSKLAVDIDNNFEPHYIPIKGKGSVLKELRSLAKKSQNIYLASDPDREGEAIAWHVATVLGLDLNARNRIEFNEITANAIKASIEAPHQIDMNKVNAQQARRILDRLVGYGISPLLWKCISSKTSAGRVQSVALKLICDLEDEIKAFVPEKYWEVKGEFGTSQVLSLYKIDSKRIDKIMDKNVLDGVQALQGKDFVVSSAKVSKKTKNPPLPLKTSTMQQLASSYLGFSPARTMRIAQGLYEGIDIKGTHIGLITYMRTDSTRVSDEAVEMTRKYIETTYGKEYVGAGAPKKQAKSAVSAQDAHECVRPTDITLTPEEVTKYLDKDQIRLYRLIWERFLISQLAPMKYDQFELICQNSNTEFRGTLTKITFDGYYKIFKDEDEMPTGDFPDIKEGENLNLKKLLIKEDMTKPPARYTESSLVKKLEAEGIGRPSTYATIIETLKKREYVDTNTGKSLVPTSLGYEIKEKLDENFPVVMNVKFTAGLETKLDEISEGQEDWVQVLRTFNDGLTKELKEFATKVEEETSKIVTSDVPCDCGKGNMILKSGRYGRYLGCPDTESPCDCKVTLRGVDIPSDDLKAGLIHVKDAVEAAKKSKMGRPTDVRTPDGSMYMLKLGRFGSYLESENYAADNARMPLPAEIRKMLKDGNERVENGVVLLASFLNEIKSREDKIIKSAGVCEKCGKPFEIKRGRFGKFLACTGYPECKNIKKIPKEE